MVREHDDFRRFGGIAEQDISMGMRIFIGADRTRK
jgi:hypothetical protein